METGSQQKIRCLLWRTVKKTEAVFLMPDVPCGYRYYVKEIQAPEHYYKQVKKARYEFQWIYQDDKTQLYTFPKPGSESEAVFLNQEVTAEVTVQKVDAQSGLSRPQQMASLKGAVYGHLCKRSDYIGRWRWRDSL